MAGRVPSEVKGSLVLLCSVSAVGRAPSPVPMLTKYWSTGLRLASELSFG